VRVKTGAVEAALEEGEWWRAAGSACGRVVLWLANRGHAVDKLRLPCYHLVGRRGGVEGRGQQGIRTNSLLLHQSCPFGLRACIAIWRHGRPLRSCTALFLPKSVSSRPAVGGRITCPVLALLMLWAVVVNGRVEVGSEDVVAGLMWWVWWMESERCRDGRGWHAM
jgi:hypothetical protein